MNPPFSASPNVEGRFAEAAMRHIGSALARLAEGGRLVAITGHNIGPDQPAWRDSFVRLQAKGPRRLYRDDRRQGLCPPRYDHRDAADRHRPRSGRGSARLSVLARLAADAGELLDRVSRLVPPRPPVTGTTPPGSRPGTGSARPRRVSAALGAHHSVESSGTAARSRQIRHQRRCPEPATDFAELAYDTCEWTPAGSARLTASLYEGYALQSISIPDARPHPTKLVQSARDGRGRPSPPLLPAVSAAAPARRRHPVRRATRERDLCRRGACRPSRRVLHRRRHLRPRLGRPGRRRRCRAVPPWLVSRRRHWRRQGPPGRRGHSRQLAQRTPPGGLDLQIR